MIDEARRTTPDIYMIEAFNPALDLLGEQLRLAGVRNVASIVALAISDQPDLFEGAWYTDSYVDENLRARFEARYPDTRFVAHMIPYAYDSLNILLDGFESGTPIADYVRGVTRHQGAAGVITRDTGARNFRSSPAVWVITDGKRRISLDSSDEADGARLPTNSTSGEVRAMSRNRVEWVTVAVLVLGLLAGAYPIVQARNRTFYPAGQEVAAPFMH